MSGFDFDKINNLAKPMRQLCDSAYKTLHIAERNLEEAYKTLTYLIELQESVQSRIDFYELVKPEVGGSFTTASDDAVEYWRQYHDSIRVMARSQVNVITAHRASRDMARDMAMESSRELTKVLLEEIRKTRKG